jgi:hypothetical protein
MAPAHRQPHLPPRFAVATLSVLIAGACGGTPPPQLTEFPPPRAATATDRLLPLLPPGVEVLIELDLARARQNPVLEPLTAALTARSATASTARSGRPGADENPGLDELATAPLETANAVVVASYRVGSAEAQSLTLVAGGEISTQPRSLGAVSISKGIIALGPSALISEVQRRSRMLEGLALSPALLGVRARAMPEGAAGALLRVTAELSFEARIALARQTNLDPPPARLAVWMDAIDDAAAIVLTDCDEIRDPRGPERLHAAVRGAIAALAADPRVAGLGLVPSLRAAQIERRGSRIKVAVVVGPQRLQRAVQRALAWAGAPVVSALPSEPR